MGSVLIHSRRSFPNLNSREEARTKCILWSIDSICSHNLNRVIFALDDSKMVKMVERPKAWPSYRHLYSEIMLRLNLLNDWRLICEDPAANRGAFLIARSASLEAFGQSYVANGAPGWLSDLFENEKGSTSVQAVSGVLSPFDY